MKVIDRCLLDEVFKSLRSTGHTLVGPAIRDGAVVYEEISTTNDLPVGYEDDQDGGRYRLRKGEHQALFSYVVGPQSWKRYLFPPRQRIASFSRDGHDGTSVAVRHDEGGARKLALIGVRPCELHAISIQDRVFLGSDFVDQPYRARRLNIFILAVNCARAGETCFCDSMGTGPKADAGFDLAVTEITEDGRHEFVVEVGSPRGAEVMAGINARDATDADRALRDEIIERARRGMGRSMETEGLRDMLATNASHPRWEQTAKRCLSCANCTMVCPTCFCSTVEEVTDLSGHTADRWRTWDSCFTVDFSYMAGGAIRASTLSRYRQWLTHKLSSWHDQFGTVGCVGCGRCITWCPVGIDLTEEVDAIRFTQQVGERTRELAGAAAGETS